MVIEINNSLAGKLKTEIRSPLTTRWKKVIKSLKLNSATFVYTSYFQRERDSRTSINLLFFFFPSSSSSSSPRSFRGGEGRTRRSNSFLKSKRGWYFSGSACFRFIPIFDSKGNLSVLKFSSDGIRSLEPQGTRIERARLNETASFIDGSTGKTLLGDTT